MAHPATKLADGFATPTKVTASGHTPSCCICWNSSSAFCPCPHFTCSKTMVVQETTSYDDISFNTLSLSVLFFFFFFFFFKSFSSLWVRRRPSTCSSSSKCLHCPDLLWSDASVNQRTEPEMKKKLKTTTLQIRSRSWQQKKPKPHFSCCCKKNHKLVVWARMNEGKIPPTSRLQTSWLVCCSTERKTHERRDREAQKLGSSNGRSTKEKEERKKIEGPADT